jgi:hypothetical protein
LGHHFDWSADASTQRKYSRIPWSGPAYFGSNFTIATKVEAKFIVHLPPPVNMPACGHCPCVGRRPSRHAVFLLNPYFSSTGKPRALLQARSKTVIAELPRIEGTKRRHLREGAEDMEPFLIIAIVSGVAVILLLFCSDRRSATVSSPSSAGRKLKAGAGMPLVPLRRLLAPHEAGDADRTIIWGMQIPALRYVFDHEPEGAPRGRLRPMYTELARRYPEIYEGHPFEEWIEFFVAAGVFHFAGKSMHITPDGYDLLSYLSMECEAGQGERFRS